MNKIQISNPKITPPNSPSKNMLAIVDSGANLHLAKKNAQQWPQS